MVDENLTDAKQIKGMGFSSLIYSIFITCFLGMATYNIYNLAKVDSYISAIIGMVLGIIPLLLVMYIIKNSNGEDIVDLNIKLFGKVFGNIVNIIINVVLVLFASLILYNLSLFLDTQFIPDTSSLYVKILVMVPVLYAASKDIGTISRVSQIIFIINIGLFLLSAIGIFTEFDANNLLPVLENGVTPVFKGGIQYALFGGLPLFLLTVVPFKLVSNKEKVNRNVSIIYIITNVIIFCMFVITIGVLGYEVISIYKYPEYMVLKSFSLFGIVERIENTLALQFTFSMSITITLIVYICSKSVKSVFKKLKSQQLIPTIISIAIIAISSNLFENSAFATNIISKYAPYIVGITFSFLILFIASTIFLKNYINNKNEKRVVLIKEEES